MNWDARRHLGHDGNKLALGGQRKSSAEAANPARGSILAPPIGCHLVRWIATPRVNNVALAPVVSAPLRGFFLFAPRAEKHRRPSVKIVHASSLTFYLRRTTLEKGYIRREAKSG
ncbi:hypothetical protein KM043_014175 [Ampulex compressa]|nr:hypothetical protein KM043_014175 [Ampulex compressa]